MSFLTIISAGGYKQRPDYKLQVFRDGRIRYNGYFYVGITGQRKAKISQKSIEEIQLLSNFLLVRNQKNFLKKQLEPAYRVRMEDQRSSLFEIDARDVVSEDLIGQILELTGAAQWVQAKLGLYLILNKPNFRSKELAVVQSALPGDALDLYMKQRSGLTQKPEKDFNVIKIGVQKSDKVQNPLVYFSFTDYRIDERSPALYLNQGPKLNSGAMNYYLYISFGKRYNDPKGSYHLVLAEDRRNASHLFRTFYPHFMPNDFQQVDLSMALCENPLFSTHLPVAVR